MFLVSRCDNNSIEDLDDEDITVEIEEDNFAKKDAVLSSKQTKKSVGPPKDKEKVIEEVLRGSIRFNQMQKIPSGTFSMGTDEMITKDGEMPARK